MVKKKSVKKGTTKIVSQEKPAKKTPETNELLVLKRNIEAILFAAGKALEIKFIAELCNTTISRIKNQLDVLEKEYFQNPVLMIFNQGSTWKMTVRGQYLDMVSKIVADTELSKTVLETLSMIAYRNPGLQSDIVKARGQVTYDHVAELVELGFVIKERIGRSYILKLTEKFYEYFEVNGKKIKEVFQPVNDRISEQLRLGNFKTYTKNQEEVRDIFDKTKEERLGELEIYRVENEKNAEKINNIRDSHKGFLESIDDEINSISQRTDTEESDIALVKSSDVQDKINQIKIDEADESELILQENDSTNEGSNNDSDEQVSNDKESTDVDTDKLLQETEEVMDDFQNKSNDDSDKNVEDKDNK